jgi:hypothetical protein
MLAGLEAERRQCRRAVLTLCAFGGAGGDYNAAVQLVASAARQARSRAHRERSADEVADELERARQMARGIVRDHWRAVQAVATKLLARQRLAGPEILRLALQRDGRLRARRQQAQRCERRLVTGLGRIGQRAQA